MACTYTCVCVFQAGDRLAAHPICSSLVSSPALLLLFFSKSVISRTHGELSWGRGHEKSLITAGQQLMK